VVEIATRDARWLADDDPVADTGHVERVGDGRGDARREGRGRFLRLVTATVQVGALPEQPPDQPTKCNRTRASRSAWPSASSRAEWAGRASHVEAHAGAV
jgi:hypothetical protein